MASGPTSRYPDAVHQSISPRLKPGTSGILYASPCGGAYSQYRRFRGGFTCFRLILPQRFARALGRVRVLFREAVAGNAGVLLSSVPRAAILREAPALAVGRFTSRTPHRLREEPARSICLRQKELFLPHFFVKKALLFFCIPVQPCSLSDSLTELKLGSYLAAFRYGPKDKRSRPHGAAPLFQRCAIRSLP